MIRIKLSIKLGELRWNQADLARATHIRPNTISEMYNEDCGSISIDHLDRICEALNCNVSDLVEYVPNKKKKPVAEPASKYST